MVLSGEGSEEVPWPLSAVQSERKLSPSSLSDARHLNSFHVPLVPSKVLTWCWSSDGVNLSKCVCGARPFRGEPENPSGSSAEGFFCHWFLQSEVTGTLFLGWEPWAREAGVGLGPLAPQWAPVKLRCFS